MSANVSHEIEPAQPAISLKFMIMVFTGVVAGSLLAVVVLPQWLPGLTYSVLGAQPKAYWLVSRGSAWSAYSLLWLSMISGMIVTNKLARLWPGGPTAIDLHEYFSLLGLGLGLFHALILMGDHYINYNLAQVLLPFNSINYRPLWVGIGQVVVLPGSRVELNLLRAQTNQATYLAFDPLLELCSVPAGDGTWNLQRHRCCCSLGHPGLLLECRQPDILVHLPHVGKENSDRQLIRTMGPVGFEPTTKRLCIPPQLSLPFSGSWAGLSLHPFQGACRLVSTPSI